MHEQNPALARQGLSDHTILVACYLFCGLCVVWCLASVALALLVFRRVRWAWFALVLSTTGVAAFCLIATAGSLVALAPLAAAGATLALLLRPESRRWLADQRAS
jgi:O-antigen ligase